MTEGLDRIGFALLAAALLAPASAAAEEPPLAGCYQRVYDAAHLKAHKGQIVVKATLLVKAPDPGMTSSFPKYSADADLKLRVRGHKKSFDSHGACSGEAGGLDCGGSLSAAEADTCKSKADGVRDCRIDPAESGDFKISAKPPGVLVTIPKRLELVSTPYDGGPFLSLSGGNAENHAFALEPAPAEACK